MDEKTKWIKWTGPRTVTVPRVGTFPAGEPVELPADKADIALKHPDMKLVRSKSRKKEKGVDEANSEDKE